MLEGRILQSGTPAELYARPASPFVASFFGPLNRFKGWVVALVMLGLLVLVQQLEGQVLHPFLTGSVVAVHPLGVLLAVITGTTVGGIAGGFFAIPIAATAKSMIRSAREDDPDVPVTLPIPQSAEPAQ